MKLSKFLVALMINVVLGLFLSAATGLNPIVCAIAFIAIGIIMYKVSEAKGVVMFDGLAAEVWLPDVKDQFYPDSSFLNEPTDFSSLVNNDALNLQEAGNNPSVLVNNNIYPITSVDASDLPIRKVLDTYDTTSTIVRNAIAIELAYDQRKLYTKKHKDALLEKFSVDAAYIYAPTGAGALNPVVNATGGNAAEILDSIIDLQTAYNNVDAPTEGRILVLDPNHAAIIAKEDKKLYKMFEGAPGSMLFGFKTYMFSRNAFFITATGLKAAKGVAFNPAIHSRSSFSFLKNEVMKAQGTFQFFSKLNDPDQKGDVFNFQMRGLVEVIRNKYRGAIIK